MAKPVKLPDWDTTEVNSVEPDLTHKEQGWLAPGGVPEKPPFQTFNYWMNTVWKWIKSFNQQGVVEWDGTTTYDINDVTKGSDGRLYESLIDSNTNNDPLVNLDKWIDIQWRKQTTTHDMTSDADYTLTTLQNRYGRVVIVDTGTVLTVARNIIVDNIEKDFIVQNDTLQDLTVKTSTGTGIVVKAGAFAVLYNDSTNIIDNNVPGIGGVGYTWVDETANRVKDTIYTNTNGKPIFFVVRFNGDEQQRVAIQVDGITIVSSSVPKNSSGAFNTISASVIVPNGSTYLFTSVLGTIDLIHELK